MGCTAGWCTYGACESGKCTYGSCTAGHCCYGECSGSGGCEYDSCTAGHCSYGKCSGESCSYTPNLWPYVPVSNPESACKCEDDCPCSYNDGTCPSVEPWVIIISVGA